MPRGSTSADWTPERRKNQSEAIRKWKPWQQSTGPKSRAGKHRSAMRSLKTGYNSTEVIESRKILMELRRLEIELQNKLQKLRLE